MEFFQRIDNVAVDADYLKQELTLSRLPELCASISTISHENKKEGVLYCVWGEFYVRRDEIRDGVRFSLLNCPHALAWTITFNADAREITIHCTIDKIKAEEDFIDSIDTFVEDWSRGITKTLNKG